MAKNPELSIVLPCRNEEKALPFCIKKIKEIFKKHKIDGEIIVSDSSIDKSPEIAKKLGARLVKHDKKGYGIAYLEGFKAVKGKYVVIADADGTYDFDDIPKFLYYLRKGFDFVIGDRFGKKMQKRIMPWTHRYIGNPVLSGILRLFFKSKVKDAHCGIRGIRKKALDKLELKTTGMEFASEMVIKAGIHKLKTKQFAVKYFKRIGPSKLSTFSDGWRHLRFMSMYAPDWLFLIPGLIFFIFGIIIMGLFMIGPVKLFGMTFYNRPMILGSFFTILGYQIIAVGIYAKTYMKSIGFIKKDKLVDSLGKLINFETGILLGTVILLIALLGGGYILFDWLSRGMPALSGNGPLLILTIAIIGIQTMFSAFFISILLVEKK